MRVICSMASIENFGREHVSPEQLLKRYAVLFDEIIFDPFGCPIGQDTLALAPDVAEWIALITSNEERYGERRRVAQKVVQDKRFRSLFIDQREILPDLRMPGAMPFEVISKTALESISDFCFAEIRRRKGLDDKSFDFDIDEVNALSADLIADIGVSTLAVEEGLDVIPSFSPIVGRALARETELAGGQCEDIFGGDFLVPALEELTWSEILELRTDRYAKRFRGVLHEMMLTGTDLEQSLRTKAQEDLWSLAKDVQPRMRESLLGAIGSNLPCPIINLIFPPKR